MSHTVLDKKFWVVVIAACALSLPLAGVAAANTWVDEVWTAVAAYKTTYPDSNFDPYLQKLAKVQEGISRGDQQIVRVETDRFLKMLQTRAHGINDVAADELYNFTLSARATDQQASTASSDLGIGSERPMSAPADIPDSMPQKECGESGQCDYWLNDMYDPGPG